tara:strand:+ start:360 stop:734 length:375 start_codon:yes stop_codon:yes gene_type:complete
MASELRVNTLKDAAGNNSIATSFVAGGSAKARHASNDAGTTLYGSLNVSSLGDTATGKQTITFTTAMSDLNYSAVSGSGSQASGSARFMLINSLATTSYIVNAYSAAVSLADNSSSSAVHGDLA